MHLQDSPKRCGFVATRICGTDGVSMEIGKWVEVFERMGHTCVNIAGKCDDRPAESFRVISETHFVHPVIAEINASSFGVKVRGRDISEQIRSMAAHNFEIARQFFGYERVEHELQAVLRKPRLAAVS